MSMAKKLILGMLGGRGAGGTVTTFTLTCTTTGAQTLAIQDLAVAVGKTVLVDWGDGNTNIYTSGSGTRSHSYASAGAYQVKFYTPENITGIDVRDTKLSGIIDSSNKIPAGINKLIISNVPNITWTIGTGAPVPAGLTQINFSNAPNVTWTIGTGAPVPAGLTSIILQSAPNITWTIGTGAPVPAGLTLLTVIGCPGVTVVNWTNNAIRSIQAENEYNQANVDAFIDAIWANKANFTYALPTLDLAGGSNVKPGGVYQAASPPTTALEKVYDLVNGNYTPAGPEWVVTYQLT